MTCVSEISVYGIIISDDKNIYINKSVGFLLRTKEITQQEGGIMSGSAAIDMPYLIDLKVDNSNSITLN
jgi:hypothetical protein